MRKSDSRMIAPDVIKILACIFVVVIHHKSFKWPSYVSEYLVLHALLLVLCLAIGIFCFLREKKHGKTFGCAFSKGMIPIFVFCGFLVFKKFPVTVFILLSSYFMGRYFLKPGNSIRTWYKADNVIPRILRFYIPFAPVFVLCILYKIFVLR